MDQLLASGRDLDSRRFNASDRAEDLEPMLEAATVFAVAAVGGLPILVRTGKGEATLAKGDLPPRTLVFDDLYVAAEYLIRHHAD